MIDESQRDARFVALVDVIRRSGAAEVQIRYSDDEKPVVWMAVVGWRFHNGRPRSTGKVNQYEADAGTTPMQACYRLAKRIFDGGECTHCGKATDITDDWSGEQPLDDGLCWYVYDSDAETFRRSCGGERA